MSSALAGNCWPVLIAWLGIYGIARGCVLLDSGDF